MPLKMGKSHEIIRTNVRELVKAGHDPKKAIAIALSHSRKMADGGMVDNEDSEMNRSLSEINADGVDYSDELSNPEEQKEHMSFAKMLHQDAMKQMDSESFAMGGLVEEKDSMVGNKPTEEMESKSEEPKSVLDDSMLKAIMEKKKKRKFGNA